MGIEGMLSGADPSAHGSGKKIKQERSGLGEETWRLSKAPRISSSEEDEVDLNGVNPTSLLLRSGDNNGRGHTTMLSFSSSSKSEEIPFLSVNGEDSSASISIPFFQSQPKQGLPSGNVSGMPIFTHNVHLLFLYRYLKRGFVRQKDEFFVFFLSGIS